VATDLAFVVIGLVALLGGAWLVVHHASELALRFGLSRMLVGATVVAFGTSAPEFIVSVLAAVEGSDELAVGNVVGSNMANIALVLGSGALLKAMTIRSSLLRWDLPVLGVSTGLLLLLAANGSLGRIEGTVMFALLIVYVAGSATLAAERLGTREARLPGSQTDDASESEERGSSRLDLLLLLVGLLALALGAELLVRGSVAIADDLEVSELVIGALLVALGTSLPELATTVVAAWRNEHEIAVANAVGSCTFNVLGVLGAAAVAAPLTVNRDLYQFEMPVLAITTLVLVPIARRALLRRREGAVLIGSYALFAIVMIARV
jgi:cation:H+ antiporter